MRKRNKNTSINDLSPKKGINGDDLFLISKIASSIPYNQEYISLLIRRGRVYGEKIGRNWHISQKSLETYLASRSSFFLLKIYKSNLLGIMPNKHASIETKLTGNNDLAIQKGLVTQESTPKTNLIPNMKKELDELEKMYKDRLRVISSEVKELQVSNDSVCYSNTQSIVGEQQASLISVSLNNNNTNIKNKNLWSRLRNILKTNLPDP